MRIYTGKMSVWWCSWVSLEEKNMVDLKQNEIYWSDLSVTFIEYMDNILPGMCE